MDRKLTVTAVYDVYWKFAFERQNVFFNRLLGNSAPWTSDPIIGKYKFTNAYRALDRVSQYLIHDIIIPDSCVGRSDKDKLFRILLYKIFNKVETWRLLEQSVGDISWSTYSFKEYDNALSAAFRSGKPIYSAAYIMASGQSLFTLKRKHQNHLKLLEHMINRGLCDQVCSSRSMADLYSVLLSYPLIGPFLAYQYATDINYSELTEFSEEEFVKAGPGARDGIDKCFSYRGNYSAEDIIRYMMNNQETEFKRLGLPFNNLFGRPLKLIDCQNLFCEVGKYARVSHPHIQDKSRRMRIKQIYKFSGNLPIPCFPVKWGLRKSVRNFINTHRIGKSPNQRDCL